MQAKERDSDAGARDASVGVGRRVGGYRLAQRLADDALTSAFVAFPDNARSPADAVVIQIVKPPLADRSAFAARFLAEAWVAARVDHPNAARVLDYGVSDGRCYVTRELLFGRALADISPRTRARPLLDADERLAFAAYVVREAASGLEAAHAIAGARRVAPDAGRRDASPARVLVTYDGGVRVLDACVARARARTDHTTPSARDLAYLAPEQIMGGPADRRTDVWGLGVLLFELIAERPLFPRDRDTDTYLAVTTHRRAPLAALPDTTPAAVIAVLDTALAPEPRQRFASAASLGDALGGLARQLPVRFVAADVASCLHALFPGADADDRASVREAFVSDLPLVEEDDGDRSAVVPKVDTGTAGDLAGDDG